MGSGWRALLVICSELTALSLGCSLLASTRDSLASNLEYVNYFLHFRGPDFTGTASHGAFHLVHNLLHMTGAITAQPFISADNRTAALFNGEIYNFRDLQKVLRPAGPPYRSDGECILEAYAHWGAAFTRHFEGEFAIAIFDLVSSSVLVSTDPFGVKPLFVAVDGDEFGVSSYRSGLARAGHTRISQLEANRMHIYRFDAVAGHGTRPTAARNFRLEATLPLVTWKVRQHKQSADDWEAAFEAAVAKRARGIQRGTFLPLSSGYDSGAIHLAMLRLGVPHTTFSVVGAERAHDQALIRARIAFARNFAPATPHAEVPAHEAHVLALNRSTFRSTLKHLQLTCEQYNYRTPRYPKVVLSQPAFKPAVRNSTRVKPMLPSDTAAVGVAHICSHARARGLRTLLTGSGADETMTDYGFNGVRYGMQSQFGGYWPSDAELESIFPWDNFVNGSQRNYLAKDEYVTGAYGVEGRFPFLDAAVVQEQLWLAAPLKNTYYADSTACTWTREASGERCVQSYPARSGLPPPARSVGASRPTPPPCRQWHASPSSSDRLFYSYDFATGALSVGYGFPADLIPFLTKCVLPPTTLEPSALLLANAADKCWKGCHGKALVNAARRELWEPRAAARAAELALTPCPLDELFQMALYLGIDPERHPHLIWLAHIALTPELPPGWAEVPLATGRPDSTGWEAYYFHAALGLSQWEHPHVSFLAGVARRLVVHGAELGF